MKYSKMMGRSLAASIVVLLGGSAVSGCVVGADRNDAVDDPGVLLQSIAPEDMFPAPGQAGEGEKACPPWRADHVTANYDITWLSWGEWGSWANCASFCPAGSYAYGVQLVSETDQKAGDDTAVNAVRLNCYDRWTGVYTGTVNSNVGPWGDGGTAPFCSSTSSPIVGGVMKWQPPQGGNTDDAAITNMVAKCKNNQLLQPSPSSVQWGSWLGADDPCQPGTAVCGIKTQIEPQQGGGDDTALNGAVLYCCDFPS